MRAARKETSEIRSSFVQLVLILFQVWVSRKNVPESEGYPYTWWLVEHSEACLCRCLSTRRYVQGDQKCCQFRRPDRKFLSGNWSSSSYRASYWGGSWWVSRRKTRDSIMQKREIRKFFITAIQITFIPWEFVSCEKYIVHVTRFNCSRMLMLLSRASSRAL